MSIINLWFPNIRVLSSKGSGSCLQLISSFLILEERLLYIYRCLSANLWFTKQGGNSIAEYTRPYADRLEDSSSNVELAEEVLIALECNASIYLSHLRQLYRRLKSASPYSCIYQRAVFYGTFFSALLTILHRFHTHRDLLGAMNICNSTEYVGDSNIRHTA